MPCTLSSAYCVKIVVGHFRTIIKNAIDKLALFEPKYGCAQSMVEQVHDQGQQKSRAKEDKAAKEAGTTNGSSTSGEMNQTIPKN